MLVFLMEQVKQLCCPYFQKALKQQVPKKYMWEEMRLIFSRVILNDWETLYRLPADNGWAMDLLDSHKSSRVMSGPDGLESVQSPQHDNRSGFSMTTVPPSRTRTDSGCKGHGYPPGVKPLRPDRPEQWPGDPPGLVKAPDSMTGWKAPVHG